MIAAHLDSAAIGGDQQHPVLFHEDVPVQAARVDVGRNLDLAQVAAGGSEGIDRETSADEVVVTIEDTTPPSIDSLTASSAEPWPPNHKMKSVAVSVDVSDLCSDAAGHSSQSTVEVKVPKSKGR